MYLSLNKAAKEAGISKSTLSDALQNGRLTARKDDKGRWQIDPAALFQVFPRTSPNKHSVLTTNSQENAENRREIEALNAKVAVLEQMIEAEQARNEDLRSDRDEWRKQAQTLAITQERPSVPVARTGLLARLFGQG
jgi:hypothetical protein